MSSAADHRLKLMEAKEILVKQLTGYGDGDVVEIDDAGYATKIKKLRQMDPSQALLKAYDLNATKTALSNSSQCD